MRSWQTTVTAVVVAAATVFCGPLAHAKRGAEGETGKAILGVRPWAYAYLEDAYGALEREDLAATAHALDRMRRKDRRLNAHERALMWQTWGYVHSAAERYPEAIDAFRHALAGDALPDATMQNVRYNLAQLALVLERYDEAIAGFHVWLEHAVEPAPNGYFMLAMAYLQTDRRDKALVYAREAVAAAGEHPREPWLQLLASLLIQNAAYREAAPVMERLVADFPKKAYFTQLSALYGELGEHDRSLATLELAHVQGLLTEDVELRTLVQLYLYGQVPVKAAQVLARALDEDVVEASAASWQLLADAWLQAKERERAIEPMAKAARLADTGEGWLRLARVQLDLGAWGAARDALVAALRTGGLVDPGTAHVLIGVTHVSQDQLHAARRAFEDARHYATTEGVALQWLATVESRLRVLEAEATTTAATTTGAATGGAG